MSKIGIFSGTFDPVHMGHVAFALEAMATLGLSEVVFLPEIAPRIKTPSAIQHRRKMLELSLADYSGVSVRLLEIPRFSIRDTLPELQDIYGDAQLVLLLGSDLVRTFKYRWPGLEDLFTSTELAIGLRGEDTKEEMTQLLKECAKDYGTSVTFHIIPSPRSTLASTQVRLGEHTIDDIHADVAAYIKNHNLYKS